MPFLKGILSVLWRMKWLLASAALAAWIVYPMGETAGYKRGLTDGAQLARKQIEEANAKARAEADKAISSPDFSSCDPFKWNRSNGKCEP